MDARKARLEEQYYLIEWTPALVDKVLEESYSPDFGARPIKRYIQDKVETLLADRIVRGEMRAEKPYVLDASKEGIFIREK